MRKATLLLPPGFADLVHAMNVLRTIVLLAAAFLAASSVNAQQVFVDYDRATAFSQFKTFKFVATGEDLRRSAPELHRQVAASIRSYLAEAKMQEVESDPDIYVTYHASTRERFTLGALQFEYVYSDNWGWGDYWGSYGTRSARVVTFTQGSLVIDVYTAEGKELVWRGIAVGAVAEKQQKNAKKIDRAIRRIAKQWEKTYPYGKAIRSRG